MNDDTNEYLISTNNSYKYIHIYNYNDVVYNDINEMITKLCLRTII